jgi:HSP20 family protein
VYEEGNQVIAELNAPGIDPQKVDIVLENGHLKISGSRETTEEKKGKNYYSKEIQRGSFLRMVPLPSEVDIDATTASYKNGVLKVTMPKAKGAEKAKKVTVKVEK